MTQIIPQSIGISGMICVVAEPEIGDYVVIGGTGAYSESMSPENYNSHRETAGCHENTQFRAGFDQKEAGS